MANPVLIAEFAPGKNWNDVILPNGADLDGINDRIQTSGTNSLWDITGNIEQRYHITFDDYTPAAAVDIIVKGPNVPSREWKCILETDGKISVYTSEDGTNWNGGSPATSTAANTLTNATTGWLAWTLDVDGGTAGVGLFRFYEWAGVADAPLSLSDWTEIGTGVSDGSAPTSLHNASAGVDISTTTGEISGIVHEVQVWDGLQADGGTLAANPRFHDSSVWAIGDTGAAVDALGQEGLPSSPVWHNREWKRFYEPFTGQWHQ